MLDPQYLGDSVYIQPDPQWPAALVIYLDNGQGVHKIIHLDPEVWNALSTYIQKHKIEQTKNET